MEYVSGVAEAANTDNELDVADNLVCEVDQSPRHHPRILGELRPVANIALSASTGSPRRKLPVPFSAHAKVCARLCRIFRFLPENSRRHKFHSSI